MTTRFIKPVTKLALGTFAAIAGSVEAPSQAATSAVSCEEIFTNQHQYVSLISAGAYLSEHPSPLQFKFTLLSDRIVIRTMGGYAETAEGRKAFPPVQFSIQRPWRIVVNSQHRLIMVLGSEPLMLAFDQNSTNVNQGWKLLNPESAEQ